MQRRVVFLGVCVLLLAAAAEAQNPPRYYAITNAKILPVSGPAIEGGTVVIANGLIAAVGKDVAIPPEAWVIDGKGLTVYPGLIDALSEVGLPAAPARPAGPGAGPPAAAAPGQQQRPASQGPEDRPGTTPWVNAADEIRPDERRVESWRNAGFTTALTSPRGGFFPGQGAVINLGGERAGEMVVRAPAALLVTFSGGGTFTGFPGSLMGAISYVKQVFLDTQQFAAAQVVYDAAPRGLERPEYDRTVRVISAALRANRPVLVPGNTDEQILRALELAAQFSLPAVIYGGQMSYAVADAIAAKKFPVLVNLRWPERDRDADPEARDSLSTLRFRDRAASSPAALAKAGVKFAFYSEGVTNPADLRKNVKKAIDAGLAADAALRALTLGAAEILGVADRTGSIEPGKMANLVVADGDLFNDRTRIKWMFVDGRRYEVREQPQPAAGAGGAPAGTLAGNWSLIVNSPDGDVPVSANLTMTPDGTVSGSVTSPFGTSSVSSGSLSGNRFTFSVQVPTPDGQVTATFSGRLEGNRISGTVSFQGQTLEFSGTRPGQESEWIAEGGVQ